MAAIKQNSSISTVTSSPIYVVVLSHRVTTGVQIHGI